MVIMVGASMVAGAALFAVRPANWWPQPCQQALPKPLNLFEKAERKLGQKIYSQWGEETLIRHFFDDRRDGFFLDVGAADCCSLSTTYYLEARLGWRGIAVDANASYRKGYEKNRHGSKFFSYFVSDTSDGLADFYFMPKIPAISSGQRSHLDKFDAVRGRENEIQNLKIPTITLNKLLEHENVKKIDFLSLDIEGFDLAALNGFDIQKYRPDLVCVEIQKELEGKLQEYFTRNNYRRIEAYLPFDHFNWYFAPAERI
jgi:FkbM family methyltransferase